MSSTNAPFGLRPSFREGGQLDSCVVQGTITSGYATALFLYSPVKLVGGVLQAAAATDASVGSFMGVEYDDPVTGRRIFSNQWVASTAANNITAWYTKEPYLTYEIQADASLAQSNIGNQADIAAPSGNTVTGISSTPLSTASISSVANKMYRIVGLTPGPDNSFGDSFTIVQVQISKHQYVATIVAIA